MKKKLKKKLYKKLISNIGIGEKKRNDNSITKSSSTI